MFGWLSYYNLNKMNLFGLPFTLYFFKLPYGSISYDLTSTTNYNSDFTLENCLFGSVKISKNTDVNKYKYFGYGIGFDGKGLFTHPTGSFGNNAIIFGVNMSSYVHADNKRKRF